MMHFLCGVWIVAGLLLSFVLGNLIGHVLTYGWFTPSGF